MAIASNLGFSRVGPRRELKFALEAYWSGTVDEAHLRAVGIALRRDNWLLQKQMGFGHIPSNDFSFYDHVLDTAAMVGAVPVRYGWSGKRVDLTTYFAMARGIQRLGDGTDPTTQNADIIAMEMTKWFDTNYHYIVPEFETDQHFSLSSTQFLDEFLEARALGVHTRPVLLGPVSFLLLGKLKKTSASPLELLPRLLPVYEEALRGLADAGADWVQMDEPYLAMDLTESARTALTATYERLSKVSPRIHLLVATYFEGLRDNLETALHLPVAALHLDLVRQPSQLEQALSQAPRTLSLSLGVVDGRNIWKTDLKLALRQIQRAVQVLGSDRVLVAPSCSLLHVPVDLELEVALDSELRGWMAFAKQKLSEVALLTRAVQDPQASQADVGTWSENAAAVEGRKRSTRIHQDEVSARAAGVLPQMCQRSSPYPARKVLQQTRLNLPLFPTTTIGSFPQTGAVRTARAAWKAGKMDTPAYESFLREETEKAIRFQEETGIDVLVHGEFERNDMVEYFGEQMEGFIFTQNGWVQSYGSRCVKPPIIFGDVLRPKPMTVSWSRYAQSLTTQPVKGMLTGPVTILKWSFVRDDQPLADTCRQIALAIRDEVADLESAGISIIQIDEPALREGLPLRRADWSAYLEWAVDAFRLSTAVARDETQIHTHMCYAEFNDIIEAVGAMDADVISIETSRSQMALLAAFSQYHYPNDLGPGVYDIHSPRIPSRGEMEHLLQKALEVLPASQIWVNPDCGLKTRAWKEVAPALTAMVTAARNLRALAAAKG